MLTCLSLSIYVVTFRWSDKQYHIVSAFRFFISQPVQMVRSILRNLLTAFLQPNATTIITDFFIGHNFQKFSKIFSWIDRQKPGAPFLVENRPQTILSQFLTTKSIVLGQPKAVRRPCGIIIYLSMYLTHTEKQISRPASVNFVICSQGHENWPKSAKIAKIRIQKLEF